MMLTASKRFCLPPLRRSIRVVQTELQLWSQQDAAASAAILLFFQHFCNPEKDLVYLDPRLSRALHKGGPPLLRSTMPLCKQHFPVRVVNFVADYYHWWWLLCSCLCRLEYQIFDSCQAFERCLFGDVIDLIKPPTYRHVNGMACKEECHREGSASSRIIRARVPPPPKIPSFLPLRFILPRENKLKTCPTRQHTKKKSKQQTGAIKA